MLVSIRGVLKKRLKKLKLDSQVEAAVVCGIIKENIEPILKQESSYLSDIECYFRDGNLKLKNLPPIYLNEIQLKSELIKKKINLELGRKIVNKISYN